MKHIRQIILQFIDENNYDKDQSLYLTFLLFGISEEAYEFISEQYFNHLYLKKPERKATLETFIFELRKKATGGGEN